MADSEGSSAPSCSSASCGRALIDDLSALGDEPEGTHVDLAVSRALGRIVLDVFERRLDRLAERWAQAEDCLLLQSDVLLAVVRDRAEQIVGVEEESLDVRDRRRIAAVLVWSRSVVTPGLCCATVLVARRVGRRRSVVRFACLLGIVRCHAPK